MVMYCDTEGLVGGGTNFGHSGIFVRPKVGLGVVLIVQKQNILSMTFKNLHYDCHCHVIEYPGRGCSVLQLFGPSNAYP